MLKLEVRNQEIEICETKIFLQICLVSLQNFPMKKQFPRGLLVLSFSLKKNKIFPFFWR